MSNKILLLLLLLVMTVSASDKLNISGFARTYEGVLFDGGDFAVIQQTLNLNFEGRGERAAFKVNPMLYVTGIDSFNFRLRELYLDLYFNSVDIRVGKQQIVWGKADGVFITDIVSPLNLTEFLLPDFDEIRKGVLALKSDFYIGASNSIEAIVIPLFTPTTRPDTNSIWYIEPTFPVPPTFDWSQSDIKPSLENSEFFLKYSMMGSNVDFDVMGGYTWDDNPSMHVKKDVKLDPTTGKPVLTGITVTPKYNRLTVVGGSASGDIKGVILRGEMAFYDGKLFQTEDPFAVDALIEKQYLNYVVGIDFNIGSVKMSTQYIQKVILDYDTKMIEDQFANTATALVHYDMFRETLHLDLFSYIGLDKGDALIRPKVTYDFDDSFSLLLGSNIFVGNEDGQFGQYSDNSMMYVKVKYNF